MKASKGMTLLEVIVALAVFSIAAVAITKSISEQVANMPILQERTLAQWVADNQMVDAILEAGSGQTGNGQTAKKEGKETLADKDWYWRREQIKTEDKNFSMIKISVSDDENYQRILVQVSSYVYKSS